jgi:integrase
MLTAGKKPATVNNRMSQLSAFNKWLVANRYAPAQFTGTVRMIPVPPKARLRIPVTHFQRLLDVADRPDRRIIVALGLYLFLRGGEIRTLRVGDVSLEEGIVTTVIHKTNQRDEMPICWELDQELRRWFVDYAEDLGRPLRPHDYLVPAHRRFPGWLDRPQKGNFQPEAMVLRPYHHVQHILDAAGFPVLEDGKKAGEGVHTLRRSGARALYDALVEGRLGDQSARDDALRQVMTMLHHSSVTITEHYIGLERDRDRRDKTIKGVRFLPQTAENVVELRKVSNDE